MKTAIAMLGVICLGLAVHISLADAQDAAEAVEQTPTKTLHLQVFAGMGLSLDPRTARFVGDSARIHAAAYEGLYHWIPGDTPTIAPLLAEDFPTISEDGLTWTIKVRKGVNYHKNKIFGEARTREMTAHDFVASFKRLAATPTSGSYWLIQSNIVGLDDLKDADLKKILDPASCEGLTAVDDQTLQIKLTRPYGSLLSILTHPAFSAVPAEAIQKGEYFLYTRMVGTGPYRLQAISHDEIYALKKNTGYWGEASHLDRIVFTCKYRGERNVSDVNKGKADELHYLTYENDEKFGGDTLELIRSVGTPIEAHKFGGMAYVFFNMKDDIWGAMDEDGKALRAAVSLALTRESFESFELLMYGQNNDPEGMYPAGMEGADIGINAKFNEIDVKKAMTLLEGTKFEGGKHPETGEPLVLNMTIDERPDLIMGVEGMRLALKEIGIKVKMLTLTRSEEPAAFFSGANSDADAALGMWFMDSPDAQNFLQLFSGRNISMFNDKSNFSGYQSKVFDAALDALNTLPMLPSNLEARRGHIQTMTDELKKDRPYIPLSDFIDLRARNQKLSWASLPPGSANDLRFLKEKEE